MAALAAELTIPATWALLALGPEPAPVRRSRGAGAEGSCIHLVTMRDNWNYRARWPVAATGKNHQGKGDRNDKLRAIVLSTNSVVTWNAGYSIRNMQALPALQVWGSQVIFLRVKDYVSVWVPQG